MSVPTRNHFAKLLEEKSRREGRYITLSEVSRETGVYRKTLYQWDRNEVKQYDTSVIDKLAQYFGIKEIGDLLEYTEDPKKKVKG
jgi:transcriptional regulator with XRE-family HTH domain